MHDKKMAELYPLQLPIEGVPQQDMGFISHAPLEALIEQPFKKPRKGAISFSKLLYKQLFAPCG